MELTEAHLRYLQAIYDCSRQTLEVSPAAVAQALKVSRPSVTRMLGILMDKGYLVREPYGKIYLTDRGVLLARKFSKRTEELQSRIPRMGLHLSAEEIAQTACQLAAILPESCWEEVR